MNSYTLADVPPRVRKHIRENAITGCWEWLSTKTDGYGQVHIFGRNMAAHRVVYELLVRGIGPNREIDHLCRFTACVNPAHLEVVTSVENKRRGQALREERLMQAEIAQEAGSTFLSDVLSVMGDESREHSRTLCRLLADRWPEKYAGWTPHYLGAMLARRGIKTHQMWRGATAESRGVNLRGVRRVDVTDAIANAARAAEGGPEGSQAAFADLVGAG